MDSVMTTRPIAAIKTNHTPAAARMINVSTSSHRLIPRSEVLNLTYIGSLPHRISEYQQIEKFTPLTLMYSSQIQLQAVTPAAAKVLIYSFMIMLFSCHVPRARGTNAHLNAHIGSSLRNYPDG